MLVTSSGCVSFRKKFVRKSKADQGPELFLELKQYDDAPTETLFHSHFIYVKGWLEELAELVMYNGNKKRMRKSIDAAIDSFTQINAYLTDDGKERTRHLYTSMLALRKTIYDPFKVNPGNAVNIVTDIKRVILEFKHVCAYEDLYPYFADRDNAEKPAKG
jgi:hypothetical protein